MKETVLTIPGIDNSGPAHWQTRWEAEHPGFRRVQMADWARPERGAWTDAIEGAVRAAPGPVVLVAHSLGCLAVAHWASQGSTARVKGALLVAAPDPAGPAFPAVAVGFAPLPQGRLPFPGILVASRNDPYGGIEHARRCAADWGCTLVDIGNAGHINDGSGLGSWRDGFALLDSLR